MMTSACCHDLPSYSHTARNGSESIVMWHRGLIQHPSVITHLRSAQSSCSATDHPISICQRLSNISRHLQKTIIRFPTPHLFKGNRLHRSSGVLPLLAFFDSFLFLKWSCSMTCRMTRCHFAFPKGLVCSAPST